MFHLVTLFIAVFLTSRTFADIGTFEVDLLFPRNGTWAPTDTLPIVFGVQNPALAAPLAATKIYWSLYRSENISVRDPAYGEFDFGKLNETTANPYFASAVTDITADTEGTWAFRWRLEYGNCFVDPDDGTRVSYTFSAPSKFIIFTTTKSATIPSTEAALPYADSCGTSQLFALNVTSIQDVPVPHEFQGQRSCAVLGATPTNARPCAAALNPAASSSVSAALSHAACVATHISCPSPTPNSGVSLTAHDMGTLTSWTAILALSLMLFS
jgi:hypothetical protein